MGVAAGVSRPVPLDCEPKSTRHFRNSLVFPHECRLTAGPESDYMPFQERNMAKSANEHDEHVVDDDDSDNNDDGGPAPIQS